MINSKLIARLKNRKYRDAFVASQINIGLPFQIRALLKQRGWTQEEFAEKTGMLQPRVSAICKPGGTKFTIETLRRVAAACDVALMVKFVPFSELARVSEEFNPETFRVPSFVDDNFSSENVAPVTQYAGVVVNAAPPVAGTTCAFLESTTVDPKNFAFAGLDVKGIAERNLVINTDYQPPLHGGAGSNLAQLLAAINPNAVIYETDNVLCQNAVDTEDERVA